MSGERKEQKYRRRKEGSERDVGKGIAGEERKKQQYKRGKEGTGIKVRR